MVKLTETRELLNELASTYELLNAVKPLFESSFVVPLPVNPPKSYSAKTFSTKVPSGSTILNSTVSSFVVSAVDFAVIVTLPSLTPVTKPVALTVAVVSSLVSHVIAGLAVAGKTVAFNCNVHQHILELM